MDFAEGHPLDPEQELELRPARARAASIPFNAIPHKQPPRKCARAVAWAPDRKNPTSRKATLRGFEQVGLIFQQVLHHQLVL